MRRLSQRVETRSGKICREHSTLGYEVDQRRGGSSGATPPTGSVALIRNRSDSASHRSAAATTTWRPWRVASLRQPVARRQHLPTAQHDSVGRDAVLPGYGGNEGRGHEPAAQPPPDRLGVEPRPAGDGRVGVPAGGLTQPGAARPGCGRGRLGSMVARDEGTAWEQGTGAAWGDSAVS